MVEVHVRGIEEEMWNEFKESVIKRYGKLHTVLGQEVGEALRAYMGGGMQRVNTHTQQKKEKKVQEEENSGQNSNPKIPEGITVGKTRAERINNVGEMLMNGTPEITDKGLQRFIATQGVGDERVTESYIKTMKLRGWLVAQGKDAGMAVMRSSISVALGIQLPVEALENMMPSYKMPEQVEGNGGRH